MVIFFNPPRLLSINSSLLGSNNCGTKGWCAYRSHGASHSAIAQQHFCTGGGSSRAREPNGWLPSARLCSGARLRCLLAKVSPLSTGSSEPGRESSALLCVCISLGTGRGELGRSEHLPQAGCGEEIPSSSRSIVHFSRQIPPALHN